MKKILELGTKTGLKPGELGKMAKLTVLGLAALAMASLAACFKGAKSDPGPAQPSAREQPEQSRRQTGAVNTGVSPADINAPDDGAKNCGPYPGYPCGTRYYTVSVSDFRI